MDCSTLNCLDRRIIGDLYLTRGGAEFIEDIVNKHGARFGGSDDERAAADFIHNYMQKLGAPKAWKEEFNCLGWTRRDTVLTVTSPKEKALDCIALPFCPAGVVEAPLVYLGEGDPQTYADNRHRLKGAIAMVSTATPRFYHRAMHRGEKLGRALEAGAVGFIWMRGEAGGLPETGSARFNRACEVPAISVSYETGQEMLRLARNGQVMLKIASTNATAPTQSYNVIAELTGTTRPEEVIVVGGHYDGHDISQSANDNAAGVAVVLEALRALAPHREYLGRTIRFVAFAQEEMGLIGSEDYVCRHSSEKNMFMLNLDGAGRGTRGVLALQGWPELTSYFSKMGKEMREEHVSVGDRISLYSDMYHFASLGIPSASYTSTEAASSSAPRGWGHTYWDSLDKINPRAIQADSIYVARMLLRLSSAETLPFVHKTPADFAAKLKEMGFDEILRYELRPIPGE